MLLKSTPVPLTINLLKGALKLAQEGLYDNRAIAYCNAATDFAAAEDQAFEEIGFMTPPFKRDETAPWLANEFENMMHYADDLNEFIRSATVVSLNPNAEENVLHLSVLIAANALVKEVVRLFGDNPSAHTLLSLEKALEPILHEYQDWHAELSYVVKLLVDLGVLTKVGEYYKPSVTHVEDSRTIAILIRALSMAYKVRWNCELRIPKIFEVKADADVLDYVRYEDIEMFVDELGLRHAFEKNQKEW